ncbi:MAG: DUF1007 family protein [Campylobacterota bacterium]
MLRILFLLFSVHSILFGCALCTVYQPSVNVTADLETKDNRLEKISFTWTFSKAFTEELARDYDKNGNGDFEKKELRAIEKTLLEYIQPRNYLTTIKYNPAGSDKKMQEQNNLSSEPVSTRTDFKKGRLLFYFTQPLSLQLERKGVLFVQTFDKEEFFSFIYEDNALALHGSSDLGLSQNPRTHTLFAKVVDRQDVQEKQGSGAKTQTVASKQQQTLLQTAQEVFALLSKRLEAAIKAVKDEGSITAFFMIMLFSFAYGALHAAGPGHGKTVVASYMFSSNKNIKKALVISLLIGLTHAFSALLLTVVIYILVTGFLMAFVDNVNFYVTKLSAVVITAIGLHMLYKRFKADRQAAKAPKFSLHKPSCGCASCRLDSKTTDLGVILAAGLVPCPGTVVIFILTITAGVLWLGFVSAVFMSLGMSLVIFVTALFSLGLKRSLAQNTGVLRVFEYLSILLIIGVGAVILII